MLKRAHGAASLRGVAAPAHVAARGTPAGNRSAEVAKRVPQSARLVPVGRILAPYGLKGWVKVLSYAQSPENLSRYSTWWVGVQGRRRQVSVAEFLRHGNATIARLEGCENRDQAALWGSSEIAVEREAFPPAAANEVYQADLIGLAVINRKRERLGVVTGVFSNGAHEVLCVEDAGRERLLPFVAVVIGKVDLAAGEIVVDWELDW